jgi:type II restriction enzyme
MARTLLLSCWLSLVLTLEVGADEPSHIRRPEDLVTKRLAVREGFLNQALVKMTKAAAYVRQARELRTKLEAVNRIDDLVRITELRDDLLFAVGFSEKAIDNLSAAELNTALDRMLQTVHQRYPDCWQEELVFRFLLTKGDSLGGSMRNLTGLSANKQLADAVLAALKARGVEPRTVTSPANKERLQMIAWPGRALLFNKTPRFLEKNIDVILLRSQGDAAAEVHDPSAFLACGELKGGIDPAGADEHWKTADSALDRIREAFSPSTPHLFFIGAAIEPAMAEEIVDQLESGHLARAANLTSPQQLRSIAAWLVDL